MPQKWIDSKRSNITTHNNEKKTLFIRRVNFFKTYLVLLGFSLKILSRKSPSCWGSKVEGTIQYSPGFSLWRPQTSRMLMNEGDFAVDGLYLKKRTSKGPLLSSFNWNNLRYIELVIINNQSYILPYRNH